MVIDKYFKSLSVDETIKEKIQSEMIVDNVIGVMSVNGGAGASTIVANIAYILSKYNLIKKNKESLTDLVIGVIDFDVFKPMQHKLLVKEVIGKGIGLHSFFVTGKGINENIIRASNTLSLFTASPYDDIYEYFDVTDESVSQLIDILRDRFDILLVDIPNIPACPLCYEAVKSCNKVFMVWDESVNSYRNSERIIKYFDSIKIRNKFTHVIYNKKTKTPLVAEEIERLCSDPRLKLKLLSIIPYSQDIVNLNLKGDLYVEQGIVEKKVKNAFMKICSEITQIKLSNILSGGN